MKYTLYDYQDRIYHNIRSAIKHNRAVLAEAPTGSGKSIIMAAVVDSFLEINKKWNLDRHLYFLVDELYLQGQFSDHLINMGISHDLIGGGNKEGRHVNIHVATIQSLSKHRPKRDPDFFVVDEAHLSTSDSYMNLFASYPDTKILGFTATCETGSGKGLSVKSGNGIFDVMVPSPVTMLDLTEQGYLSWVRYLGVPIKGIETLHMQAGDYKDKEVEKLLKERGTYGDAIKEMHKFPDIQSNILVFCRSVKACYEMQTIFHAHGYTAEVYEGSLGKKDRKRIMNNFTSEKTQILVTCRMVLKGVDLPDIRMGVDLAPVASRATQRQKVGRTARAADGKEFAVYLDMVGNHRVFPDGNVYADITWNFDSDTYNKKPAQTGQENYCPVCYDYIPPGKQICPTCGAGRKAPSVDKKEKHMDGELVEIVPLKEREYGDRAKIERSISAAIHDNDILALKKIGEQIVNGKKLPFWIYWKMNTKEKVVNIPLLYRIQRELGYKKGWIWYAKKQLAKKSEKQVIREALVEKEELLRALVSQYEDLFHEDDKFSLKVEIDAVELEIQELEEKLQRIA